MKQETMDKAIAITRYKAALAEELRNWNEYATEGVVSPITFRLGGNIEYMNKEAFDQFRLASILWLNARIAELDSDFANLC